MRPRNLAHSCCSDPHVLSGVGIGLAAIALVSCMAGLLRAEEPILVVPASDRTLHVSVSGPVGIALPPGRSWRLVEQAPGTTSVAVNRVPERRNDGSVAPDAWRLIASIPGTSGREARRFRLEPMTAPQSGGVPFRIAAVSKRSMGVWEGDHPILVYNHGTMSKEGVPADRNRSTYVHPLHGLDGEVLTDDFPADHHHHRGLFWAWPHVVIAGKDYDLWTLKGIRPQFKRWLSREAGPSCAVLGVENGWYVGDLRVLQERVWLEIHPATGDERAVDVTCTLEAVREPITLDGAEGKSYGGMNLRFGPGRDLVITTPLGNAADDLLMTRLPWADLSGRFTRTAEPSGAALLVARDHPDFPPTWLTRHYGVLCVGWPGVKPTTLEPGRPIRLRYRVWIHRGLADGDLLARVAAAYDREGSAAWAKPGEPKP